jgi:hypothetical protein
MPEKWSTVIQKWPDAPHRAVMGMVEKYGQPDMVCSNSIEWLKLPIYAWLKITSAEVEHNFPLPHKDFIEVAVPYKVPRTEIRMLAEFDGSLTVMPTQGLVSSCCDSESHNLIALNLAHDVIQGKIIPEEARRIFAEIVEDVNKGKKHEYAEALQFTVERIDTTREPDKSLIISR